MRRYCQVISTITIAFRALCNILGYRHSWRCDKRTNDCRGMVWVGIKVKLYTCNLRGLVSISGMRSIWINNEGMKFTHTQRSCSHHYQQQCFICGRPLSICYAAVRLRLCQSERKILEFKKPFYTIVMFNFDSTMNNVNILFVFLIALKIRKCT